jgi:hypothetical protein
MSIKNLYSTVQPSLSLDFANTKRLDPRITFNRTTTARYYDGKTVAKAEENFYIKSDDFTDGVWAKPNITITANTTSAPDGTSTADKATPNAVFSTFKEIRQDISATTGLLYTYSIFAKKAGYQYVQLLGSAANWGTFNINFDLDSGIETAYVAGSSSIINRSITSVGDGWYRISVTITCLAGGSTARLSVCLIETGASARGAGWTPNGTDGVYIWGAQVEQRSSVTAYTPTTTQPITNYIPVLQTAAAGEARFDHNPVTGESLGLLIEEQRANLALRSEEFNDAAWTKSNSSITANTIIAPDGTLTGDKLVNSTTSGNRIFRYITVPSSSTICASIYVKKGEIEYFVLRTGDSFGGNYVDARVNLTAGTVTTTTSGLTETFSGIIPVGNGWYRVWVGGKIGTDPNSIFEVRMTNSSWATYTGDGYSGIYIWGAQLEAGAFPTSYIKTEGSTVTRNADAASMTGANFSSWYRADEGTLYGEFRTSYSEATIMALNNSSDSPSEFNNSNNLRVNNGSQFQTVVNGTNQVLMGTFTLINQNSKMAYGYKVNDFAGTANGNAVVTDTSGTVPATVNQMMIGRLATTLTRHANGPIKKLAFYPARLSDAQLQALTTV